MVSLLSAVCVSSVGCLASASRERLVVVGRVNRAESRRLVEADGLAAGRAPGLRLASISILTPAPHASFVHLTDEEGVVQRGYRARFQ